MCQIETTTKKYRLADFFESYWDDYLTNPKEPILPEQFRAVNSILACRTAILGADVYVCTGCGSTHTVYHSCNNRFCPTCGYMDTNKWCNQLLGKMINAKHHHITVMLPEEFRPLAKENRWEIYNLFISTAAEAIKQWFWHRHRVKPGIMTVLHTFGDDKKYHVHVHMIVTDGGMTKKGTYHDLKTKRWLVKYDWLCNKKFKPIFLQKLKTLNKKGQLQSGYQSKEEFNNFVDHVGQKTWRMNIKESLSNTEDIVRYTCRYTKRACMSEYKIKEIDGEYISFEYKDYKNGKGENTPPIKIKRMHYRDFFPQLLQHVPQKGFHMVRYQGAYARTDKIPEHVRQKPQEQHKSLSDNYRELQIQKTGEDPFFCKTCQREMIFVFTYFDTRKRDLRLKNKLNIPQHIMSHERDYSIANFEKERV